MKVESIRIYPKRKLSLAWSEMAESAKRPAAAGSLFCLRCGAPMRNSVAENAMSRFVDVYICSQCGTDEAMRDAAGNVLHLREWYAVKHNKITAGHKDGEAVLVPTCFFGHVFTGPKKTIPLQSSERPASELVYSRSDYDDSKWWTKWIPCQEEKPSSNLIEEVDSFHSALFSLPEFRTLSHMRAMCWPCAEKVTEKDCTEFNLYSETEHFYTWLQLIIRVRDYNVYVHYYLKEPSEV